MKRAILSLVLGWTIIFAPACTPQPWETTAEQIATAALPIAASIVGVADPQLAPLATTIEGGAQAVVTALEAAQKTPTASSAQSVTAAVNSLQSNVQQLLAALQVKGAASSAQATAFANLFAQAVDEIAQIIEQNTNTAVASLDIPPGAIHVTRTHLAKGWKAKQLKKQYQALVKAQGKLAKGKK